MRWVLFALLCLAACTAQAAGRADAAAQRVTARLTQELSASRMEFGAPVLLRIFKQEAQLELWIEAGDGYALFRTYPICAFSGRLGPKLEAGDGQAPEGFYEVLPGRMNPWSSYHLSFDLGYPNAFDRAHGRSGSLLMVHGDCVSVGCYAMGDAAIEEIYTLLQAAFDAGQARVPVHAFPFRFAPDEIRLADPVNGDFWRQLQAGWLAFERSHRPPRVTVRDGRYHIGETAP